MSSGCIRLFNHDIIDLYARVPTGTPVTVLGGAGDMVASAAPVYSAPSSPEITGSLGGAPRTVVNGEYRNGIMLPPL